MHSRLAILACASICLALADAAAQGAQGHFVPHVESGLAEAYPGDHGIAQDTAVIFAENFEQESLEAVVQRWEDIKSRQIMSLESDVPARSGGSQSLLMAHVGGQSTGGHLYRRLLPGHDQLYLRYYVKFDPDCHPVHHFVWLGGYNPSTRWPQGGAGERPAGSDRWTSGLEPRGASWVWDFYTYWMEMRSGADLNYWGNDFVNDPALRVPRGEWICVEQMMKMNDPASGRSGEQQFWIDGQSWEHGGQITSHIGEGFPRGHWVWDSFHPDPADPPFEGFRWRSDASLDINFLWLELYITGAPEDHLSKVWFDDVVVATRYIGPLAAAKTAARSFSDSAPASQPATRNPPNPAPPHQAPPGR